MKQLSDGVYEIPSDSSFGKHYVVNLTHPGRPECTCTNWAVTRNKRKSQGVAPDPYECKHVRQALRADPNLLKKQRAAEAEAYRQRDAAAKAEQEAKTEKMKAELLSMRNDLAERNENAAQRKETVTETAVRLGLNVALPAANAIDEQVKASPIAKRPRRTAATVAAEEKAAAVDLMAQLEAAIAAQKQGTVMVVCPTEPDPDNGAEGCGETFTAVPDEDYVECPSCGLAFDVARAQALETM